MKRLTLLFLLCIALNVSASEPMIFFKEPLYMYPDSTVVYNLIGDDEYGEKIVTIQNPDKTWVIGGIIDADNNLTIENIRAGKDEVCPLISKINRGNCYYNNGQVRGNIIYGMFTYKGASI